MVYNISSNILFQIEDSAIKTSDFKIITSFIENGGHQEIDISEIWEGGYDVIPHSLPYQAALLVIHDTEYFFCGGSLISSKTVLTAAHCLLNASLVAAILGAHKMSQESSQQHRLVYPEDWHVHEGFDSNLMLNDIGLLLLREQMILNEIVQPIKLPSDKFLIRKSLIGKVVTASGRKM